MVPNSEDASQTDLVPPPPPLRRARGSLAAVAGFFSVKAAIGFVILAVSAKRLSVAGFSEFSQLFLYLALLASVAAAGVQNGVVREVAAAQGDRRLERTFVLGGLLVWVCFSALVALIAVGLRDTIAIILVDDPKAGTTVAMLTICALLSGVGTLLCSALSGGGRAPLSLLVQGVGMTIGGVLCLARLLAGDAAGAALAYAAGPLLGAVIALWVSRHWLGPRALPWQEVRAAARGLLHYSGTFLVVVSVLPLVLFGVRYVYRLEFGSELLGYWLMANRASDVTTQVVGLYLSQVFLPHVTRSKPGADRLREIRRTLALGVAVSAVGTAVFAIGGEWIISLVLSDQYRDALPFILGYLVGDAFRVGGNVALFTALAARRLILFMVIETGLAVLVGATILAGIGAGFPTAAYWGYLVAHATAFAVVLFLTRRLSVL